MSIIIRNNCWDFLQFWANKSDLKLLIVNQKPATATGSRAGATSILMDFLIKVWVCVNGGGSAKLRTDLQRGRQDAQAVQALVELRVLGPT